MQKISSYLYPNRVQILADVASFTVEYTNVYQRTVKIYKGIDNVIEFDIKNADQKRIDLTTITSMQLNVMDASGNELPSSPYVISPTTLKGIATVTIPSNDLEDLNPQYLRYSITGEKNSLPLLFYCDTRFDAAGTIELLNTAMPIPRKERVYDTYTAEIDLKGLPTYHSSAIPAKFYEAVKTETLNFEIHVSGFIGSIWLDATKNSTINTEAWKAGGTPWGSWTQRSEDGLYTGIIPFGNNIDIKDYNYIRVSFNCPTFSGIGANFIVTRNNNEYDVQVKSGGTGYSKDGMIRIVGSQLGGVDGVNDLLITITAVDASSAGYTSSYAVSSVLNISWEGIAESGVGTHIASGTNVSGTVDKIVVS